MMGDIPGEPTGEGLASDRRDNSESEKERELCSSSGMGQVPSCPCQSRGLWGPWENAKDLEQHRRGLKNQPGSRWRVKG